MEDQDNRQYIIQDGKASLYLKKNGVWTTSKIDAKKFSEGEAAVEAMQANARNSMRRAHAIPYVTAEEYIAKVYNKQPVLNTTENE